MFESGGLLVGKATEAYSHYFSIIGGGGGGGGYSR